MKRVSRKRKEVPSSRSTGSAGEWRDWDITLSIRAALVGVDEAQHLEPVRLFRSQYLPDGLLGGERALRAWLQAQVAIANGMKRPPKQRPEERLGLESLAREVMRLSDRALPASLAPKASDPTAVLDVPIEAVWWADGVGSYETRPDFAVSARPYGAIGELFWLGLYLENELGWRANSARAWVIAKGAIPWVSALTIEYFLGSKRPVFWTYLRHRVVIDASAEMPVARVAEVFAELQAGKVSTARYPRLARPLAPAILEATLFAVERNDGRAWEDVLEEWNERVGEPEFQYEVGREGTRRFAKDVRRTYKALLGKQLKWVRGPGQTRGNP